MTTKLAIYNLALGKLGVSASGRILSLTENSAARAALDNVYHALRQRELRRNYWAFATTRTVLRVVAETDVSYVPLDWNILTAYGNGEVVGLSGETYIALEGSTGETPATATIDAPSQYWEVWRGPLIASEWDDETSYFRGEVVCIGGATFFLAKTATTAGVTPVTGDEWQEIQVATTAPTIYRAPLHGRQHSYVKPRDLLRIAPLDPKRPQWFDDALVEGNLIVTSNSGPVIDLRYIRDEAYASRYDVMFSDALACCMASETADEITQSNVKHNVLDAKYKTAIADARLVNAIEAYQSIEPTEDEWVTCRSGGDYGFGYVH